MVVVVVVVAVVVVVVEEEEDDDEGEGWEIGDWVQFCESLWGPPK